MTSVFLETPKRLVDMEIDGQPARVPEGATVLDACRSQGVDTPTLCYLENLTPVNVCRVCVVEVEGSRTLVPSCSRKAEPGMKVHTGSERVRTSRKMVLEFLASAVNVSLASADVQRWIAEYGVDPARYGTPAAVAIALSSFCRKTHPPVPPVRRDSRAPLPAEPTQVHDDTPMPASLRSQPTQRSPHQGHNPSVRSPS